MLTCKLLLSISRRIVVRNKFMTSESHRYHVTLTSANAINRYASNNTQVIGWIDNQRTITSNHQKIDLSLYSQINQVSKRYKVTRSKGKKPIDGDNEEESDDEDEVAGGENPLLMENDEDDGSKATELDVNSLRLDSVAKAAFNKTRAKVEEAFYKGDILVNGEVPTKKSVNITVGDEIDMLMGPNSEDPTLVDYKRVQITELPDKANRMGHMKIKVLLEKLSINPKQT